MSEINETPSNLHDQVCDPSTPQGTENNQECSEFQSRMAARIGEGEDLQTYPHMLTCERCRSLVRDLEFIAAAARDFYKDGETAEEPGADVWTKIVKAIEGSDTNSLELTSEA